MLLVLDNCEHLLGACAAITAALLQPCAKVHVLATSREPLRVAGESTVSIPPLLLGDAVELFSWRAAGRGAEGGGGCRVAAGFPEEQPTGPRARVSSVRSVSVWSRVPGALCVAKRVDKPTGPRARVSWVRYVSIWARVPGAR